MIKIYLNPVPHACLLEMFFIDERSDGRRFIGKPTEIFFDEMIDGERSKPTLVFDRLRGNEFLQSLANALAEVGYKVDISSEIGELKATKYHLEDLRKLVFDKGGK